MLSRAVFNAARVVSNALFGRDLYNRSLVMRTAYDAVQAMHVRVHPGHRKWRQFRKKNPLKPWFVPEAVAFLETLIKPGMTAFEWGAGGSTIWLALQGVSVTSIEKDPKWRDWVNNAAAERRVRHLVDVRITEACNDDYAQLIRGSGNGFFDLIIVDGAYRAECVLAIQSSGIRAGLIVVDNADRADIAPLLKPWRDRLIATFDSGVDRTSIYRN
jgi:predicted O-methyltransferase YrrM